MGYYLEQYGYLYQYWYIYISLQLHNFVEKTNGFTRRRFYEKMFLNYRLQYCCHFIPWRKMFDTATSNTGNNSCNWYVVWPVIDFYPFDRLIISVDNAIDMDLSATGYIDFSI